MKTALLKKRDVFAKKPNCSPMDLCGMRPCEGRAKLRPARI